MQDYFDRIEDETQQAYTVAKEARGQGKDPEDDVDIPRAEDLAAKAVRLISADKYPELEGKGLPERIRELEQEYQKNDERVALEIGREIAENNFYEFDERVDRIDAGLRVGLAYMTGGITTAPLEGIADTELKQNDDGSTYLAVHYAGPIRSAGGTASALSVLLADYIRQAVGIERYRPRDEEIDRYAVEVEDYFTRVTKKQYTPEREETKMIAENVPIEITGTPTEQKEVSNHKDMERIDTNRIRGGMCLIYLDGLPLKASKIRKRIENYGEAFGLEHWDWVNDYLDLQHEIHSSEDEDDEDEDEGEGTTEYEPSDKFLGNLTAGRPVFAHPGEQGAFRLRYGRSRTGGIAACSFHPATMEVADRFMAVGTQLKIEYPGKATVSTPCDDIAGPIVRLASGEVRQLDSREEAAAVIDDVDEILFLGDILVPVGEFIENGKELLPSPYVEEWWAEDVKHARDTQKVTLDVDLDRFIKKPREVPEVETALMIAEELAVPLHPAHTFHWHQLDQEAFTALYEALAETEYEEGEELVLDDRAKEALEQLFVEHRIADETVVLEADDAAMLYRSLQPDETERSDFADGIADGVEAVLGVEIRDQAPIYLGARMGRPEKAKRRELKGKPQLLFPCGKEEGGRMRNLIKSYNEGGEVTEEVLHNYCEGCNRIVHFGYCPYCGEAADSIRVCTSCDTTTEDERCPSCGSETRRRAEATIPLKELLNIAKRNLDMRRLPELLKSPRAVTGKHRHVEPLEKGLLRQKYDLYVNKDGTIRHDSSDLAMTHFKPKEIGTDVETLRELGYEEDINGKPLESADQVVRLKPQDIVVSKNGRNRSGAEYLYSVTCFIDDLLEDFYGLEPFYDLDGPEEIVGELVIGLAPHTSGGIVGRIVGFTEAKGTYAHPYWHTAKRRNADGDEDSVIMLMDGLLNFSRQFLPDRRGTRTMDAPLILSTVLNPDEVDDESWNVDVDPLYSRAFYQATQEFKEPWEISGPEDDHVTIAEDLIEQEDPFAFDYTHETTDLEDAPLESSYVTLGEMAEKVKTQLELGAKTKAVQEHKVAELLLSKHFVPDIKGNLRAFSNQELLCTSCNHNHRRVPLQGRCRKCGGDLSLTVSEGTIRKYLEPSEEIADNFAISTYKRQQIYMLKRRIQSLFGKEHRQSGLGQFT